MDIGSILNQPITQAGGVLALIAAFQKAGVDVVGFIKWFFGSTTSINTMDEVRNAIQPLLSQMETLSLHFNHETTDELGGIKLGIEKLLEKQDEGNEILRAIDKYGIKCRKD